MSEKFIPEHVDPFRFADQSLQITGKVSVVDMPRLSANLVNSDGEIRAELAFGIDEQGLTYVKGRLEGHLSLQCQRCMEPMIYETISDFSLGIVNTLEEAKTLPEHYEPVLAHEGFLALRDLIEDEVILNLPIIPRHEPELCKVAMPVEQSVKEGDAEANPFQVLASLKKTQ